MAQGTRMATGSATHPRIRFRLLTTVLLLVSMVAGPAQGAGAVTPHETICDSAPNAGFTDVAPESPHKADIDCLQYWGITNQTGTFDPAGLVSRWQMALFMTRTQQAIGFFLPSGPHQGFADIDDLLPEYQVAINQVKQLSITSGASPTTYEPHADVSRWQMALFLTRLVTASAVELPLPGDHGFADVSDLSPEAQVAVALVKEMGITQGTSPTTFAPFDLVTREQMASFLVRTLKVIFRFDTLAFVSECSGDLPEICTDPDTTWVTDVGEPLTLRHGWSEELPFLSPEDSSSFYSSDARVEYYLDGKPVNATERLTTLDGVVMRMWEVELTSAVPIAQELEVRWHIPEEGHVLTIRLTIGWS